jgi:hypothetical protein
VSAHSHEFRNPTNIQLSCPYTPGNEILLRTSDEGTLIRAQIIRYFPATLSCCMVLRFVEPAIFNNTSQCVLKLYDRRFSTQLREDCEVLPWTPEIEKQYQDFVNCDDAREFFSYWDAEKERDDEWSAGYVSNHSRWTTAKRETYLHWECNETYEGEKKAYELMSHIQGEHVPRIFGSVVLDQPSIVKKVDDEDEDEDEETTDDMDKAINSIPGILMQHIEGFHLTDLHKHLPSEHWQSILDSAVRTIGYIQNCGIYNRDVNTRSIMVDSQTHRTMMIDFGLVCFREDSESEREWERLQVSMDEEGAVGAVMQRYLKRDTGIDVFYNRSERARRLDWRFNREEGEHEGGTEEEDEYVRQDILFDQEKGRSAA